MESKKNFKALLLSVVALLAWNGAVTAQTLGETLYLKAAMGEEVSVDLGRLFPMKSATGSDKAVDVTDITEVSVSDDPTNLAKENVSLNAAAGLDDKQPCKSFNLYFKWQDVNGKTSLCAYNKAQCDEGVQRLYLQLKTKNYTVPGVYPVTVEIVNSFKYSAYPSALDNLDADAPVYLAKLKDADEYVVADGTVASGNKGVYFSAFECPAPTKYAEQFKVVKAGGAYYLAKATDEGDRFCRVPSSYTSKNQTTFDVVLGEGTDFALQLQKVDDGDGEGCVLKTQGSYGSGFLKTNYTVYLDYDNAAKQFVPCAVKTSSIKNMAAEDAKHKLCLYNYILLEDHTPLCSPFDGQVTSVNGGVEGTEYENATDPFKITITFDRPIARDAEGNVLDCDGNLLAESGKVQVYVDALDDDADNSEGSVKKAKKRIGRLITLGSCRLPNLNRNVVEITLDPQSIAAATGTATSTSASAASKKRIGRLITLGSCRINTNFSAGAMAYAEASTGSASYNAPSKVAGVASSYDQEAATTPFSFSYTILPDEEIAADPDIQDDVQNPDDYVIDMQDNDFLAYFAKQLVTKCTEQLKFFIVTGFDMGRIFVKEVDGVVDGPVLVSKNVKSLKHAVAVKKGMGALIPMGNHLNYVEDGDILPPYYNGTYGYEEGSDNGKDAHNYFYGNGGGRSRSGLAKAGFTYDCTPEAGWKNNSGKGIVYLHADRPLHDAATGSTPLAICLESGTKLGTTSIENLFAPQAKKSAQSAQSFNIMGQAVGSSYHGILIKDGRKVVK